MKFKKESTGFTQIVIFAFLACSVIAANLIQQDSSELSLFKNLDHIIKPKPNEDSHQIWNEISKSKNEHEIKNKEKDYAYTTGMSQGDVQIRVHYYENENENENKNKNKESLIKTEDKRKHYNFRNKEIKKYLNKMPKLYDGPEVRLKDVLTEEIVIEGFIPEDEYEEYNDEDVIEIGAIDTETNHNTRLHKKIPWKRPFRSRFYQDTSVFRVWRY